MAAKQCPKCLMWVTDEERMTGQCPGCKSFFESELPRSAIGNSPRAAGTPIIQTESPETPTARAKRGSGVWSAWWMIPLALIGMRACRAVVRTTEDHGARPKYEEIDRDRIRQLLEQSRENRPSNEFTMGPRPEIESVETDIDPFDVQLPDPDAFEKLKLPPGFEHPQPPSDFDNSPF